jgi:hypothetical protein
MIVHFLQFKTLSKDETGNDDDELGHTSGSDIKGGSMVAIRSFRPTLDSARVSAARTLAKCEWQLPSELSLQVWGENLHSATVSDSIWTAARPSSALLIVERCKQIQR